LANSARNMYAMNHDAVVNAIIRNGRKRTVIVEGDIGSGKSSMLKMLAKELPTHTPCYFDCTTKDLGDMQLPKFKEAEGQDYVRFAPHEELGIHLDKPIIIMFDEIGKANPAVKNAANGIMLERRLGTKKLHPDSIVFATTNLGAEGVGDLLQPHTRNRVTVVRMRKPDNLEWITWGIENDIDVSVLGWAKDNPQLFQSFEDIEDPEENPYIYHPRSVGRDAFVTPRSLESASDWLKEKDKIDNHSMTALLMGTIGDRAAMDLMAFVSLSDQLPSLESIKQDPMSAKVPDSAAGVCMVVYRTLAALEREWVTPWMKYLERLHPEAQGLFVNGVRDPKYSKSSMVFQNKEFTQWARVNNYMFAADKV
jgi:MoxR-like ATPase